MIVETLLPVSGVGFLTFNRSENTHWGTKDTIAFIEAVGKAWQFSVPFSVGHISRKGGGKFPPHQTHRLGVDIDIRPLRKDGRNVPVMIADAQYDRSLTLSLVKLLWKVCPVSAIFFNDKTFIEQGLSRYVEGHHDHLHVRLLPGWPTLKLGDRGPHVRRLQAKLGIMDDGIFGRITEAKIRSVQAKARLAQTGQVDAATWDAVETQSTSTP